MNATAMGKTYNQHSLISWSYLSRGSVALNHTKKKQKIHVFRPNTIEGMFIKKSIIENISDTALKIGGKL